MKKALVVSNVTNEGPGLLEQFLKDHGLPYDHIDLQKGESFPSPLNYSALIVMGGFQSANDQTEHILTALSRIREAISNAIPYFGVCLGLQLGVKAMGGNVVQSPIPEDGFRGPNQEPFNVTLTEAGKNDLITQNLPGKFDVFHLHGEMVEPTSQMQTLGTGNFCPPQIVKIAEKAHGVQFHLELTEAMFEDWIATDENLQQMDREQLRKDFQNNKGRFEKVLRTMFQNFLQLI